MNNYKNAGTRLPQSGGGDESENESSSPSSNFSCDLDWNAFVDSVEVDLTSSSDIGAREVGDESPRPGSIDTFPDQCKNSPKFGGLESRYLVDGDISKNLSDESWTQEMSDSLTGAIEARSMSTSVLAAVPTTLSAANRRESLPGAFRMSHTGATPPGADVDDDYNLHMNDEEGNMSVGFRTRDAHELLIEATLVCDRSQATIEVPYRSSHSSVVHHTAPPDDSMALVEAKPLYRVCFCCDMLGSWKSICFVTLVIIAIAGVAVVIERNRHVFQTSEVAKEISPSIWAEPTPLSTFVPTSLSLGGVEGWSTLGQDNDYLSTATPSGTQSIAFATSTPTTSFQLPLPSHTVTSLQDSSSPQSHAYAWIDQDPNRDDYSTKRLLQRFALATFYYSLMDGNDSWGVNKSDGWLSYEQHECDWQNSTMSKENVCSSQGEYISLSVRTDRPDSLAGSLPREIWMLTSLVSFRLYTHNVIGELSDEVRKLTDLKDLKLMDLSLMGAIPTGVGELRQLTSLKLQKNEFTSLPSELGKMKRLEYLYLEENKYSSFLPPELGQLDELKEIVCHSSSLSGTFPSEIAALPKVEKIYLSNNFLTGSEIFVNEISPTLRLLELGDNLLSGSLEGIGQLSGVVSIDLFGNNFYGSLPDELGNLLNISTLLLDSTSVTGTIPKTLGNLTNLSVLWLHDTNLHGSVPDELCNLKQTQEIDISIDCTKVSCTCGCTCDLSSPQSGAAAANFTGPAP